VIAEVLHQNNKEKW